MFLDQVIFNKTKVPVLTAVLDVTQLRQRVITDNIANVSTQGYRKKGVRFQEYLASLVRQPRVAIQVSDPRHIFLPRAAGQPEVFEPDNGVNDSGLNNVDIDQEMAELAENHLLFNVGARLLNRQLGGIKKSITGRPQ